MIEPRQMSKQELEQLSNSEFEKLRDAALLTPLVRDLLSHIAWLTSQARIDYLMWQKSGQLEVNGKTFFQIEFDPTPDHARWHVTAAPDPTWYAEGSLVQVLDEMVKYDREMRGYGN